jgi:hypothetical protein
MTYAEGRLVCGECDLDQAYLIRLKDISAVEKAHQLQLEKVIYKIMAKHPHVLTIGTKLQEYSNV